MNDAVTTFTKLLIAIGLLAAAGSYAAAFIDLRRHNRLAGLRSRALIRDFHPVLFGVGLAAIAIALLSPLDALAGVRFSAHMVQHLAVTLVVPPLLLLGTPAWLLEPWFRSSRAVSVGRFLTRPLAAYALFNVPFTLVHLPALYELMLRNTAAHLLSHGVFLLTALLLWWPVLGPLPALSWVA